MFKLNEDWRRNLAALWIVQVLIFVGFSFVFPFVPLYVQDLGVEGTTAAAQWAGVILASSALSTAIAQPLWGALADRRGRKPMVIRSLVGNGITIGLMGFAGAPVHLLILRFLQGTAAGTVPASTAMVATITPKHRLGFALGMMQVASFVGTSIGPLLGGLIADAFGYRVASFAAGFLMLAGVPIVSLFVREDMSQPQYSASRGSVWTEGRYLLGMTIFPVMIGVIFLINFGWIIVSPVLSLFVAELNGPDNAATVSGLIVAAAGMMSAISAVAIGRFSDRVGHGRILIVCLAGSALTYYPQTFVQDIWQLLLLRMLLGIFLGGLMPSANALVAETVPRARHGAAFGLTAAAYALANGIGPLSAAGIATQWGIRAVFLATGVLYTVATGCVTLGLRRQVTPRPQVDPNS